MRPIAPALFCLLSFGCLPDPDIQVPDLSLGGVPVDAGVSPRSDGPIGDLGVAHWTADLTLGTAQTLRATWVADGGPSEMFVVGQAGLILHRVGNGPWQVETSGTDANLYAVTARSAAEVYAVGDRGVILRRTGGKWLPEGAELRSSAALFSAAVLAGGEVVAVGDGGLAAIRGTAGVWTAETASTLAGAALRAVAGSKLDSLTAVGLGGLIVRRGATGWAADPLPVDPLARGNYYAVAQAGDGVYVVGEYGLVLTRGGDRWAWEKLTPPMGMVAPLHLYGASIQDGELFVVGAAGYAAHKPTNNGAWTVENSGGTADLYGIYGAGARTLFAVGSAGTLLRRF